MIEVVAVVVPARNEEALIDECLRSIMRAAHTAVMALAENAPVIYVVVVADGCTDATVQIARAHSGVQVLPVEFASVGAARGHGVMAATSSVDSRPSDVWIASTDADSVVPANWITRQLALAEESADVVIGTVRPDMADLTEEQRAAWRRLHIPGQPNGHVHGANLGIRLSSYFSAGGFPNQTEHEDNDLVDRLRAIGATIVASDAAEVVTSGRRFGRTPGGYAGYLRALDAAAPAIATETHMPSPAIASQVIHS